MVILVDTRQKKEKHENIENYFSNNKIYIISQKLDVGDYMFENGKVSVDTKENIYELASNLFDVRFQKELKRAKQLEIKLYILVEQNFNKDRILNWKSKKRIDGTFITKITGLMIYNRMRIYTKLFNVAFRFCRKVDTGKKIIELLGVDK